MWWDVLRPAKDIDHVNLDRDVGKFSINFLAENLGDFRIVNRHGNDFESCVVHVLGNVERGLAALRFSLDAENGNRLCVGEQFADALGFSDEIILPVHGIRTKDQIAEATEDCAEVAEECPSPRPPRIPQRTLRLR